MVDAQNPQPILQGKGVGVQFGQQGFELLKLEAFKMYCTEGYGSEWPEFW